MVSTLEHAAPIPAPLPRLPHRWPVVLAVVASAGLCWFGTGLTPIAWLTWLAPLPVLAIAARRSARVSAAAAFAAWFLGGLNLWSYYAGDIELPLPVVAGFLIVESVVFAAAVLLFRRLLARGRPVLAVLAPAAAWAGSEYLISLVSPAGGFSSLGYTQVGVAPVLQLASLTGVWGISAMLFAMPAAVVATVVSPHRSRVVVTAVALLTLVLGYGAARLIGAGTDDGRTVSVALVDVPQSTDGLAWGSVEARQVLAAYLDQLPVAAGTGATVVVLPEKVFRVSPAQLAELRATMTAVATPLHLTVVIGLTLRDDAGAHNVAVAFVGADTVRYDKQHLVPGLEDHFTAGSQTVLLPGTAIGLVVCKDLDYPDLGRAYAGAGAGLLLVPALDFARDGWLHSRIAVTRGVESGLAVARAADRGRLTASDAVGGIRAEAVTSSPVALVTATVPVGPGHTPYARFGDWFAWLCLVLVGLSLVRSRRPR